MLSDPVSSPFPHINGETHYVRIDGAVNNVLDLSVQELREGFKQYEVISSLQVSSYPNWRPSTSPSMYVADIFTSVCGKPTAYNADKV